MLGDWQVIQGLGLDLEDIVDYFSEPLPSEVNQLLLVFTDNTATFVDASFKSTMHSNRTSNEQGSVYVNIIDFRQRSRSRR